MKTSRTILAAVAIAAGQMATQAQAQTFQTNNGVIIGSPGVLPPPATDGRAIIPSPPGGPIPPMPPATNRWQTNRGWNGRTNMPWNARTNMPWNVRSNNGMFPGTNGVQRVPVSSNLPSTSVQPPDSSLPPMTNAPGQRFQPTQPGSVAPRQPGQPATPPPTRTK